MAQQERHPHSLVFSFLSPARPPGVVRIGRMPTRLVVLMFLLLLNAAAATGATPTTVRATNPTCFTVPNQKTDMAEDAVASGILWLPGRLRLGRALGGVQVLLLTDKLQRRVTLDGEPSHVPPH